MVRGMISAMAGKGIPESDKTRQPLPCGEKGSAGTGKRGDGDDYAKGHDRWHLFLQQSPDPRLIIENGLFVDCNRAALQFLGFDHKEQIIGMHPHDCSPPIQAGGRLSAEKAEEILTSALAEGSCRFEWRHKRNDNSTVSVEVALTKLTIDGRELVYAAWYDRTGKEFVRTAVRESEDLFRGVFELSEDAIILVDPISSSIVDANPSTVRLYGHSRRDLIASGIELFMGPEECKQFVATVSRTNHGDSVRLEAMCHFTKDGRKLIINAKCRPITFRSKTLLYCRFRDVSESFRLEQEAKLMEKKLIHTNKMTSLGTLVSSVAHEINNPNNFIMLNSSLLKEAWADVVRILEDHAGERGELKVAGLPFVEMKEAVGTLISGVMDGSMRINSIVTNLREFSQPQKNLKGPVDINTVVRTATSMLSSQIKKYTNRFNLDLGESIPEICGNSQQLEQVVINLVLNALQALPSRECGVSVVSRYEKKKGIAVIRVEDEGTGIPPEVLARIREPFFSTKVELGGTGLGVYISHSIIKGHSGSLTFQSGEGQRTTAIIALPVAADKV
jgi:PAS domain S-box-containing protein